MHKKDKLLLYLFLFFLALSTATTYYRYIIKEDFTFFSTAEDIPGGFNEVLRIFEK